MEIKTGRLLLRTVRAEDAAAIYAYRSRPEVSRYQGRPKNLAAARRQTATAAATKPNTPRTWYQFAVIEAQSGALIGDIAVHFKGGRQAELGYTLAPEYQGRGYASEAARGALGWLFGPMKIHRVTATADPRNKPSLKVMRRLGLRKEGHFKKSFWTGKEWADDAVYALLKEEWK